MEISIGARFERTEIRMYHGRKYFIGDSVTSQGERLFRTVACEKMVHSPTVMFAEMVWEHIGKFARDMGVGAYWQVCPGYENRGVDSAVRQRVAFWYCRFF